MEFTVNTRVELEPTQLREIVLEEVEKTLGTSGYKQTAINCLIPGRPEPTYRYNSVVEQVD